MQKLDWPIHVQDALKLLEPNHNLLSWIIFYIQVSFYCIPQARSVTTFEKPSLENPTRLNQASKGMICWRLFHSWRKTGVRHQKHDLHSQNASFGLLPRSCGNFITHWHHLAVMLFVTESRFSNSFQLRFSKKPAGTRTKLSFKTGKPGKASFSFLSSRWKIFLLGQTPFPSACHRSSIIHFLCRSV